MIHISIKAKSIDEIGVMYDVSECSRIKLLLAEVIRFSTLRILLLLFLPISFLQADIRAGALASDDQICQCQNGENSLKVSRAVLDNSRLRRYLRDDYLASSSYYMKIFTFKSAKLPPNVTWDLVDQWIDEEIIGYSEEVAEKLCNLRKSYPLASVLLEGLEKDPDTEDLRLKARLFFKGFRGEAKALKRKIDFMIPGLPSKPEGEDVKKAVSQKTLMERMILLKAELDEADRLIVNYFFTPTIQTVAAEDLNNNNMLIRLYRIERILESIENEI